ncbi:O-methyltransferase [Citroniella saccharovorans]|uniref:tRNA 5-hydroxyuridine methyltransferase n=1 Tax=Citroniella saccharovorans TaxID=2053367 RepID=A0AAW9MZ13_9FIRM|nr:O-methyltransferase [Citroniella saccharovorans]MEB3429825.1 O-methyltransferase [Citroniella saccharovorans]
MPNINYDYIESYLKGLYIEKDPFLANIEEYGLRENIPIIEKESLELLRLIISIFKPNRILEIGTAIGYSAISMAKLDSKINITSFEINEKNYNIAIDNIKKAKLLDRIEVRFGDASELLTKLREDEIFDFVFIDAAKSHYLEYFNDIYKNLSNRSIIFSDNVLFKGMIADDSLVPRRDRTIVRNMREYLSFLTSQNSIKTSVIPIGDGVAISLIEKE